jgi:hypothetical protein
VRLDSSSSRWNRSFSTAVIMPQASKDGLMRTFLTILCDDPGYVSINTALLCKFPRYTGAGTRSRLTR